VSASDNDRIAYLAGEAVDALTPAERAELDELKSLLEDQAAWTEPPPELEDRVVSAIADEARTRARPQAAPARARRRPRLRLGLILERPIYAAGAIAGLVAIVVVAGLVSRGSNKSATAPLHFAMVVSGTPLAPSAHGSATLTKTSSGWRINLAATGLPRLSNGRYYQAWVKDPAGTLVPVGTFNDAVNVTLWSGVPITQYRTLTVTRQQANGNPASSGQRVLTGTAKPAG
jgi:Anti-sigma-K factor rskA